MPYQLAYKDRYVKREEGQITSDTTGSIAFASIPDDIPTKLVTEWTGKQFTKLFSSVYMGAHLIFPDDANEIIWQLLKVVHQPLPLDPDGDCIEYGPSAPFIKFYPDNPYVAGDNKDGWWNEAWYQWSDFFSLFPDFAADWLAGAVGGLLEYQDTDVLCNIASLAYPTWGAFFDAGGVFPKIEIKFSGTGQINVSLLSFPLGGKAIIELDEEPNVLDILSGGILDPNAFMIELNRDILSFPPSEYPLIVIPIQVTTPGEHTLYINFIPLVNDETTFLGFGGGLRSVEMCGFSEVSPVGIEQIFWDGCALKQIVGGVESTIVTAEQIEACLDIPEPSGGGGGAQVLTHSHKIDLVTDKSTSSASYVDMVDASITFANEYANVLAIVKNVNLVGSGATITGEIRLLYNGNVGFDANEQKMTGDNRTPVAVSDHWRNLLADGNKTLKIQWRRGASGTITAKGNQTIDVTIIEFENAEDLYQQDTRYLDGVLQKQLAGLWIDVVDIDALLAPIQSLASAANTAAAAAQTTANGAVTVNSAQQTTINNHETRIDDIELVLDNHETRIDALEVSVADHETRIDALEDAPSGGGGESVWSEEFDFTAGSQGWSGGDGYSSGNGFVIINTNNQITYGASPGQIYDNKITYCEVTYRKLSGSGFQNAEASFPLGVNEQNVRMPQTAGQAITNWVQINPVGTQYQVSLATQFASGHSYYVEKIVLWGRGVNPFA
jgi:hypothetical protein